MSSSRREFIQQTVITGVGLSLLQSFPGILIPKVKEKLGVALVGLGYYSTDLLAPALQMTSYCHLTGIVTGSPGKIPTWQQRYNIPDRNVYNYETMHRIADNPDIDVIYIVLPTSMHSEYCVRAANSGKHVWCENPWHGPRKNVKRLFTLPSQTKSPLRSAIGCNTKRIQGPSLVMGVIKHTEQ